MPSIFFYFLGLQKKTDSRSRNNEESLELLKRMKEIEKLSPEERESKVELHKAAGNQKFNQSLWEEANKEYQSALDYSQDNYKIKAICHCGRKATMVLRVNESGQVVEQGAQIEIGGNDRYVSVCREHFFLREPNKI